ncbi:MAG: hypothetical protein H6709_12280 [Kofleriaceae bacterium]|nr:hypothetical protein [Myxococcales bacterium]MCB9565404.1 hypothetical protein [Kofleriaceae bacterium]MCB9572855.1 hypothetical protein [Kofleriaceae bacterium]
MSERSRYLLCRNKSAAVNAVEAAQVGALVVPCDGWTVVVTADPAAVAPHGDGPFLDYEYTADARFALHLWAGGERVARLEAETEPAKSSHFDPQGWVEHGLCDADGVEDIADLIGARWTLRMVRDRSCRTFGVIPESFLRGEDLEETRGHLHTRYPKALRFEAGKRVSWERDDAGVVARRARAATTAKEKARWEEKSEQIIGSPQLTFAKPPRMFELTGDAVVEIGVENLGGGSDGLSMTVEGGDGAVTLVAASADGRRVDAVDGEVRWPEIVFPAARNPQKPMPAATIAVRLELRVSRAAEGVLTLRARSGTSGAAVGKSLVARP